MGCVDQTDFLFVFVLDSVYLMLKVKIGLSELSYLFLFVGESDACGFCRNVLWREELQWWW